MKRILNVVPLIFLSCMGGWSQLPQNQVAPPRTVPLYHLTVVGRTISAVNYGHREDPTKIDFQGTVLEPKARGEATVKTRRGPTVIDAMFEQLPAPTKYGLEYLTYVLWAITPEGRAVNLGEIVLDRHDKATMQVTTDLQAFGLLVTAEPYYAVTQPSDVVVLQNVVRHDTAGKIEVVEARYELINRGRYTFDEQAAKLVPQGPKVGMNEYEAVLAVYEARNAVQIAQSEGADRYAHDAFGKAQSLLQEAEDYRAQKTDWKKVVTAARESTQSAEDARTIAAKRQQEERQAANQLRERVPLERLPLTP